MNLMLVDADLDNVKNFRTYIKGAYPDIRIVGSFSDTNKDIMPVIRDLRPHLILADIRFFVGAHFMRFKDIHNEFPDTRFIVYGTFNEADYMKRGGEFGILDFMYRPVKPVDLNRCLKLAASHFKREEDTRRKTQLLAQNYQDRIFQYEEIFLRGLLDGHMSNINEIKDGFSYFEIPFNKNFSVMLVRIDRYRQMALTLTEKEKHIRVFKMLSIINDMLKELQAKAFIRSFNEIPIILNGLFSVEEKVLIGDRIKHAIFNQTNIRVSIGVGRTYEEPMEIAISAREASATFGYRYRMGYNAVIPIEFVEPNNHITFRYPTERERRLVYAAVVGDYEYCKHILSELFGALAQSGAIPDNIVAKMVMTIVFRISRYISEQNLPFADALTRFFPTSDILRLTNIDDGYAFLNKHLQSFCTYIGAYHDKQSMQLHQAAKEYVSKHFYENISIAKIAIRLGTTPEKLNKVFMEKERIMLFDYVMWVRVQEAQRALKESALEEDIIAVKVGFEDVKYFRSIFRKYHGETPAEFRAREQVVIEEEEE